MCIRDRYLVVSNLFSIGINEDIANPLSDQNPAIPSLISSLSKFSHTKDLGSTFLKWDDISSTEISNKCPWDVNDNSEVGPKFFKVCLANWAFSEFPVLIKQILSLVLIETKKESGWYGSGHISKRGFLPVISSVCEVKPTGAVKDDLRVFKQEVNVLSIDLRHVWKLRFS